MTPMMMRFFVVAAALAAASAQMKARSDTLPHPVAAVQQKAGS